MNSFFDRKTVIIISLFIVVCSILLLIAVTSSKISNQTELVTTLSVAVGLTSLILALISIFQNFVSGRPAETILTRVEQATDKMMNATEALSISTSMMTRATEDVSAKAPAVHQSISTFSSKADAALASLAQEQTIFKGFDNTVTSEVEDISSRNTNGGILSCYVAALSYNHSKVVPGEKLFPSDYVRGYFRGYIASLSQFGQVETAQTDNGDIVVTRLPDFTLDQAKEALKKAPSPDFVEEFMDNVHRWISGDNEEKDEEST